MSESPDTEYTPATTQVRYAYVTFNRNAFVASTAEHEAEFDRWLAAHDREVAAKALDDAAGNLAGAGWAKVARDWLRARAAHIREGEQ